MTQLPASFRDPDGFLFIKEGIIYRAVNESYRQDYESLMGSGLYESLTAKGWLVKHEEVEGLNFESKAHFKTLHPEQIRFISYPYEWSFSQLKDAALLTLDIQREALRYGMTLKDATAYNVQFLDGRPILIDTLSFEKYHEGNPWTAYKQYCQHFVAPLALASYVDHRLLGLLRTYIDGFPLDLTSKLLPRSTWFRYGLLAHIHLHALSQKRYENAASSVGASQAARRTVSLRMLEGIIDSLVSAVSKLDWIHANTEWGSYYESTNYVDDAMRRKEEVVTQFLSMCKRGDSPVAIDFGANTGRFSRLAADQGYLVIASDVDEVAVDKNYRAVRRSDEKAILPMLIDLTNPSPGIGWANEERDSFVKRARVDVGMALALIHHIAISNNVPMQKIAALFHKMCQSIVVEFVPKSDSQVRRLLATRRDIFPEYNEEGFERAFGVYFSIDQKVEIDDSERIVYLMTARAD